MALIGALEGTLVFVFGAIIGSFLNVVIWRLPRGERLGGRSHCPHCGRQLTWVDLFPLVSFMFLRGRCRTCRTRISWRYPVVESVVGIGFLFGFAYFIPITTAAVPLFVLWCVLWAVGVVTFLIDLEHLLILDVITFTGLAFVLLIAIYQDAVGSGQWFAYSGFTVQAVVGAVAGALPLFLLWLVSSGRWIGFGDVKFLLFLGAVLQVPQVFVALLFSFWLGAIVSVPLLIFGGKSMQTKLPFGTFLVVGGIAAFLFGPQFLTWYMQLLA